MNRLRDLRSSDLFLLVEHTLYVALGVVLSVTALAALAGVEPPSLALVGFQGGRLRSCDQGCNKGAEQGFAASARAVHELEETEVVRQFVLRDAAVRSQPGT